MIPAKLENFRRLRYPKEKLQIVFVDGGSTDGTSKLIQELKGNLNVTLVSKADREGYNRAIMYGFAHSLGDVIAITGAETEFEPDALLQMVKHFAREHIGAVTGRQCIRNQSDSLSGSIETAYRDLYDFIRFAESNIDSTFDIKGEICVARREVVGKLVENPELARKGCIDACFSLQARKFGLRTTYEPDAIYFESVPFSLKESFAQMIRRGSTLIESLLIFREMILNPRYGKFGMLILPAHFNMLIVMPFVFVLLLFSLILVMLTEPSRVWATLTLFAAVVVIALSKRAQAFVKAQFSLVAANIGLLKSLDTQKFRRLPSTRLKGQARGARPN